jgi:hypothetical protein
MYHASGIAHISYLASPRDVDGSTISASCPKVRRSWLRSGSWREALVRLKLNHLNIFVAFVS